jgi:RNA polymerase sigma-70 factor (ECF subfamily)
MAVVEVTSMNVVQDDSDIVRLREFGDEGLAQALGAHHDRLERIVDLRLDPRLAGRVDAVDVLQEAFLEA